MVLKIRPCQSEADEALSLEIYNAVVPAEAVSLEESRAWKAAQREYLDLVGTLDGEPAGSAVIGIRSGSPLTLITVLPEKRRHGIGSALYQAVSDWARSRKVESLSTRVAEDDDESFEFARRRGFVEHGRERRLVLDLAAVASPQVAVHRMTGVKRAFRRRGIAAALKRAQVAWAASEGFERLEATNEVRNQAILQLNRRLGYREVPGRIMLKGPLATVTQT